MGATEAYELSAKSIDEAILIFTELKRDVHLGDAYTTKGVSYGRACSEQIKNYEMARDILLQAVGELHHFMDRLYLNMGIYYEENGDYYKAFEFFHKWYVVCRDLFGYEHSRTQRPIKTLLEPMYRRIAQEKGESLPGHEGGEEDGTSMMSEDNLGRNNEDESQETDNSVEGQTEDGDNNTPDDLIRLNLALDPSSVI